jgi:hypothetical protein
MREKTLPFSYQLVSLSIDALKISLNRGKKGLVIYCLWDVQGGSNLTGTICV